MTYRGHITTGIARASISALNVFRSNRHDVMFSRSFTVYLKKENTLDDHSKRRLLWIVFWNLRYFKLYAYTPQFPRKKYHQSFFLLWMYLVCQKQVLRVRDRVRVVISILTLVESNFQPSDLATSGQEDSLPSTIKNPVTKSRDWNPSSNFGPIPGDAREDMSDSSIPRHVKPRTQVQRRSTPHSTQPPTHAHFLALSPQVSFENPQHHLPTKFLAPTHHYSTSPSPHGHGSAYIGQYTISPQPPPMAAVHSPPPYGFSHTYHHSMVPDSSIISPNLHAHYQSPLQYPHVAPVYQYQPHSREGNSPLHSTFPGTPMYSTNALSQPTSPHPNPPTAQNSPLSPSYIGSGVFHSLQRPSPMAPHYTYSSFSGTQPPPQFGQHYTANRDSEPQGDWYYVPRHSPVAPSQQYDFGPSYSGHYPMVYPHIRPELKDAYSANSFSSVTPSSTYPPPIRKYFQPPEPPSPEILRGSVARAAGLSPGSEHTPHDKLIARRSYHPNPPLHRSEWVMWAGNIPSDATHDEIYRFFSQVPQDRTSEPTASIGVISVFLIARSNCAFINFESESYLLDAISKFNGTPLRADDTRCVSLVCRVRRKDDDLRAGVGGQRGTGMHTRWVKEKKQKAQEKTIPDQSDLTVSDHRSTSPSNIPQQLPNISLSSDESELGRNVKRSSTSDSYSSSNSNFLARNFPKRYFILKSLTEHDLDISVQTGFWATQKHNEGILDQSYRTSKDVYLIFGANKSGEFYGYARMAGPVRRGGQNISWAPSPPRSYQSPTSGRLPSNPLFFSPGDHRLVDISPLSIDQPHSPIQTLPQSAPGMFGVKYHLPTMKTPEKKHSLDQQQTRFKVKNLPRVHNDHFELDPSAPVKAMRSAAGKSGSRGTSLHSLEKVDERAEEPDEVVTSIQEPTFSYEQEAKGEESWGDCFAVEWISTRKLPFNRTRRFRNPWNHDREVKVSRDGTELEPTVGQKLLDEWHELSEPQQSQQPLTSGVGSQAGGHEGGSKPAGSSSKPHLITAAHRSTREGKEGEEAG